jgi:G:T-mismatch repair DNA endonuclease (very short patch repair protein)
MADIFTPKKRSEIMSRIRSRDTKPELSVRSMLHRLGYRFTVNGLKTLPVQSRYRTIEIPHRIYYCKRKKNWNRNVNALGNMGCRIVTVRNVDSTFDEKVAIQKYIKSRKNYCCNIN